MKRVLWLMALSPLLADAQPVYTADKELAVGKQLAAELERNVAVVNDPAITAYVNRVAGKHAKTANLRTPLTTKVISGSNAYATILPGGFLDVDSTLILDAASEAELAGVIAHQIAHLALWQASNYEQQIGYFALWQASNYDTKGTIPLTFIGGGGLCVRCGLHSFCGVGIPIESLATSRDREAKADELALGYMQNAGYDPGGLVDFYGRMPKPQPQAFEPGLTMPESTRAKAESLRNTQIFIVTSSEFEEIQRRVAALVPNAVRRTRVPSLIRTGQ